MFWFYSLWIYINTDVLMRNEELNSKVGKYKDLIIQNVLNRLHLYTTICDGCKSSLVVISLEEQVTIRRNQDLEHLLFT